MIVIPSQEIPRLLDRQSQSWFDEDQMVAPEDILNHPRIPSEDKVRLLAHPDLMSRHDREKYGYLLTYRLTNHRVEIDASNRVPLLRAINTRWCYFRGSAKYKQWRDNLEAARQVATNDEFSRAAISAAEGAHNLPRTILHCWSAIIHDTNPWKYHLDILREMITPGYAIVSATEPRLNLDQLRENLKDEIQDDELNALMENRESISPTEILDAKAFEPRWRHHVTIMGGFFHADFLMSYTLRLLEEAIQTYEKDGDVISPTAKKAIRTYEKWYHDQADLKELATARVMAFHDSFESEQGSQRERIQDAAWRCCLPSLSHGERALLVAACMNDPIPILRQLIEEEYVR